MRIFASRQCADYARACHMRVQVRRAWHVLRLQLYSCSVFVVSKPRWPRCGVVPDLHLHRQRTPSSAIYLSQRI